MSATTLSSIPAIDSAPELRLAPSPPREVRATTHACLRYAQRVLGLELDEVQFRRAPQLQGRCERGIARLLQRAECARKTDDTEVWVARTRAMVVKGSRVLTILVAPTSRGFGKRFFRLPGLASPGRLGIAGS